MKKSFCIYLIIFVSFLISTVTPIMFINLIPSFYQPLLSLSISAILTPIFLKGRDFSSLQTKTLLVYRFCTADLLLLFLVASFDLIYFESLLTFNLLIIQICRRSLAIEFMLRKQLVWLQVIESALLPFLIFTMYVIASNLNKVLVELVIGGIAFLFSIYLAITRDGEIRFLRHCPGPNNSLFELGSIILVQIMNNLSILACSILNVDLLASARLLQSLTSFCQSLINPAVNEVRSSFLSAGRLIARTNKRPCIIKIISNWTHSLKSRGLLAILAFPLMIIFELQQNFFNHGNIVIVRSLSSVLPHIWPLSALMLALILIPPVGMILLAAQRSGLNLFASSSSLLIVVAASLFGLPSVYLSIFALLMLRLLTALIFLLKI